MAGNSNAAFVVAEVYERIASSPPTASMYRATIFCSSVNSGGGGGSAGAGAVVAGAPAS